jgi:hypothetical protein
MRTKTSTSLALLFLFSFGFVLSVCSQPRSQSSDKTRKLRESFASDRERVKEARKEKYESESAPDGAEWFKRGYELHNSDRYQEAAEAFMCAVALEYRPATAMYNIACDYALLNDKENALVWLQRSLESGFERPQLVASDSDLDPLRTDPRFKKLLAAIPNVKENTRSRNVRTKK